MVAGGVIMTPTELRLRLREAGFDPIPLRGKKPE